MGYSFRLQKVLDVKEKEEDNKKNEVGIVNFDIMKVNSHLQELYNELEENTKKREQMNKDGASIQEILELNKYADYLKNVSIKKKEAEIDMLQKKLETKKEEYMNLRKQRKSYESLKEKDYEKYLQKESKEEEKVIDEIVSFSARKS